MRATVTIGLILLVILPREGTCDMLNLTDEVRKYILGYISTELEDFSLTKKLLDKYTPSITPSTGKVTYGPACKNPEYSNSDCREFYTWIIHNSTVTPFTLPISLTALYKGKKNETHNVNINNATWVMWNPDNLTEYPKSFSEEKCNFSIEVSFKGTFVYKVRKDVKGDKPLQGNEEIGRVALNNPTRLAQYGDDTLKYNISGEFKHAVTCPSHSKTR
uniref:Putative da-p36 protein n=1 Tax=Rhipicephalus pulchellus TaxID=72859 RepID=L7LQB7_RHIPC